MRDSGGRRAGWREGGSETRKQGTPLVLQNYTLLYSWGGEVRDGLGWPDWGLRRLGNSIAWAGVLTHQTIVLPE